MLIGVGTDMVEVERVERAVRKPSFVRMCFTDREWRQLAGKEPQSAAAAFAGKEAAAKALGSGFRGFGPRDIEILRDGLGKPSIELHGRAAELAAELGIRGMHVSLTHSRLYAMAFVVAEG